MSDTVKLIIEIPKETYDGLINNRGVVIPSYWHEYVADLCKNGTPLDSNSERAEVQAYFDGEAYGWEQGRKALIDDVKAEIAEEICLTDNPYTKETKYTIEHLKLLEILDNIGKADMRKE